MLGGCDAVELAGMFGTPLYVFDEITVRERCSRFRNEFGRRHHDTLVIYACKAYLSLALAGLLKEEGLGLDVVSAGELYIARCAGFPLQKAYFHGNNKGEDELRLAIEWGVGRIVVDNFHELEMLERLCRERGSRVDVLLRLSPGIDPHTHKFVSTGVIDSKFGFTIATGQAERAVTQALAAPHLSLVGLHSHLGSSLFEVEPYRQAIDVCLRFAAEMKARHGFELKEFSPGGGFGVPYLTSVSPVPVAAFAEAVTTSLAGTAADLGLPLPRLIVEPGRSIVAQAGVALYTAGGAKDVPGVRRFVFVDGGMGDNIRPPLYGSKYEALVANKASAADSEVVTIAGKFCESGDILIEDINLPAISAGDVIAVPVSGAYSLPMASNYNSSLRPAVVMVGRGKARLMRRRETYEDLLRGETAA